LLPIIFVLTSRHGPLKKTPFIVVLNHFRWNTPAREGITQQRLRIPVY
jgi:hypothetical protein